jgi:hypothetical protein
MSRPNSYKREFLTDHEVMNRAAPGGRLPIKTAHNTVDGDPAYTPIADGSPAAAQAAAERHVQREKPKLAEKREREGK